MLSLDTRPAVIRSSVTDSCRLINFQSRSICPGQHLAEKSAWLAIANILAAFDIKPALDESGAEVIPTGEEFVSGSSV